MENLRPLIFAALAAGAGLVAPATNAQGQVLLQGSFAVNTPFNLPFGPFGTSQTIVVKATVTNVSPTQTIAICPVSTCVGDPYTYVLGGSVSIPNGYNFFYGDGSDTRALGDHVAGPLAPGQTKEFIYGIFTPASSPVAPDAYPFAARLQIIAATSERPLLSQVAFGGNWQVTTLPVYVCEGFHSPFDVQPNLGPTTSKPIPLEAQLFDSTTLALVGDDTIGVAPVAAVVFVDGTAPDNNAKDLSESDAAKPSSREQFKFDGFCPGFPACSDPKSGNWSLNLSTHPYLQPGTYGVMMQSGDAGQYLISPPCVGTFVRQ